MCCSGCSSCKDMPAHPMGDASSHPGELHDQQPHPALCWSPHLPDRIKELKQSQHSVSCPHDGQHLHRHTVRQKEDIFSLMSDFPSPKPSCISRLAHLTTHASPLCCPAPPEAMERLDPQSQGSAALPELPLSSFWAGIGGG